MKLIAEKEALQAQQQQALALQAQNNNTTQQENDAAAAAMTSAGPVRNKRARVNSSSSIKRDLDEELDEVSVFLLSFLFLQA